MFIHATRMFGITFAPDTLLSTKIEWTNQREYLPHTLLMSGGSKGGQQSFKSLSGGSQHNGKEFRTREVQSKSLKFLN